MDYERATRVVGALPLDDTTHRRLSLSSHWLDNTEHLQARKRKRFQLKTINDQDRVP